MNFKRKIFSVLMSAALIVSAAGFSWATEYNMILIDRTGSMATQSDFYSTRFEMAISFAKADVETIMQGTDEVGLMYFDSYGIVYHLAFTNNKQAVFNALNSIPGPDALTPLADAMCMAATILKNAATMPEDKTYLYTYTDGYENFSYGEGATICDTCDYLAKTWQYNCNPCDPLNPNCTEWQFCIAGCLSDAGVFICRYFGNPIIKGGNPDFVNYISTEINADMGDKAGEDYYFLHCVADSTGGAMLVIKDDYDYDNDGVMDDFDNCPVNSNPGQEDTDGDGLGNICDNCPYNYNPGQEDGDGDNVGDACEGGGGTCLPALTGWGLATLILLLIISVIIVIRKKGIRFNH